MERGEERRQERREKKREGNVAEQKEVGSEQYEISRHKIRCDKAKKMS